MAYKDVKMTEIDSSNAHSVGYDKKKKELFVQFRGGAVYMYSDVPESIFIALKEAESFGSMLNAKVKGVYKFTKLA